MWVFHRLLDFRPPLSAALSTGIPHPHAHNGGVCCSEILRLFPPVCGKNGMLASATDGFSGAADFIDFVRKTIPDLRHTNGLSVCTDNEIARPDGFNWLETARAFYCRARRHAILIAQVRDHQLNMHRRRQESCPHGLNAIQMPSRLQLGIDAVHIA